MSEQKTRRLPFKRDFPRLPFKREFPGTTTEIFIFPPKKLGRATVVRGIGSWTLLFEPTDKPNIASVRLVDAKVTFSPFSAAFDIDEDGQLEYTEVGTIELGPKEFDLEISKGTLNLETGEFSIIVGHLITPESLPLLKKLGIGPLKFSFTERGRMNLEAGHFRTEAGVISLPKPFEDWTIRACEDCPPKPPPQPPKSSVDLWVNCVAPPADWSDVRENPPPNDEITICPGDPILLSWKASADVTSCKLEPLIGSVPKEGNRAVSPGPTTETVYRITTVGGYTEEVDTVLIHIFDPTKPLQFNADPIIGSKWSIDIPEECWSGSIQVKEIRIKRPAESEEYSRCFDWPHKFHLEHWSPGATLPDSETVTNAWTPAIPSFMIAGRWDFWPQEGTPDWEEIEKLKTPLCFAVKGECK